MKKHMDILAGCGLFEGLGVDGIVTALHCLDARARSFERGMCIAMQGEKLDMIGVVLSGDAQIRRDDEQGNTVIVSELGACDIFGEAYVCARVDELPVGVWAVRDCEILFMDYQRILRVCESACVHHRLLIANMLGIMARKLIMLSGKIDIIQQPSMREKVLALLARYETKAGGTFRIPYNRQELAQYLGVNRSALSRELSLMREQGLIDFDRDKFRLVDGK